LHGIELLRPVQVYAQLLLSSSSDESTVAVGENSAGETRTSTIAILID
jgi:hypothetical protein